MLGRNRVNRCRGVVIGTGYADGVFRSGFVVGRVPASRDRYRAGLRAAAVLAATAVVTASLLPADGGATAATLLGVGADKWLHATGYGVVAALADAAERRPWSVVAGVALLGLGVEFAQLPLATREFSVLDAVANLVGAVVGVVVHRLARATRSPGG